MEANREIIIFAFRYALGRRTYASSIMSDVLLDIVNEISLNDKELIINEINDAIKNDLAGDECDIYNWQKVKDRFIESIIWSDKSE